MKIIAGNILSLVVLIFFMSNFGYGQNQNEHGHDHQIHEHTKKNEVSMATGLVPLPDENKITAGLHLHYVRGIGERNRFGIGIGLETIFDEHKHHTISVVSQFRIYHELIVSYSPGVLFIKEEEEYESQFAQHIELAYEFEVGNFHIGPLFELGIEKETIHYLAGVHFGINF